MVTSADRVYCGDRPGFYAVRMAKGAVEIACEVGYGPTVDPATGEPLDRSWYWTVAFDGEVPPSYSSPAVYPRLLIGRPIDRAEDEFIVADRAWARAHAPSSPEAQPRKSIRSAHAAQLPNLF